MNKVSSLEQLVQQALFSIGSADGLTGSSRAKANGFVQDRTPMAELMDYILSKAIEARASDIHIEPSPGRVRVRFRIDGQLQDMDGQLPERLHSNLLSKIKLLSSLNIAETRLPQDGSFFYQYNNNEYDVRVSIVPLIRGEKAVLRLLNQEDYFKGIDGIDLSPENKGRFMALCHEPNGAVVIAGPVNSGKTTAMYAALGYINGSERNLVSLEDPVEYRIEGINQLQVNRKLGMDFDEALEAVLRQDYDVLAVGELRNSHVADTLIKAALAGHLVFTSVHTASAVKTIYRLLDMGVKSYLLAAGVKGILSQRLVPRLCPSCRRPYEVEQGSEEARLLGGLFRPGTKLFKRHGCEVCGGKGVLGRIAVHELLTIDDDVRLCIYQQATLKELEEKAAASGMITMWEDGVVKAMQGLLELEELRSVCDQEGGC